MRGHGRSGPCRSDRQTGTDAAELGTDQHRVASLQLAVPGSIEIKGLVCV